MEATTEKTNVLKGLMKTKLFAGLDQVTDEDLEAAKSGMLKDFGPIDKMKGRIVGQLTEEEKAVLVLMRICAKEEERIIDEGDKDGLKAKGWAERDAARRQALDKILKRTKLIKDIFWHLLYDRFDEEMQKEESCQLNYDAEFNVRVSTHEEEHGVFPGGIHLLVIGGGRRRDPLDGLAELLAGLHGTGH